MRRLQAARSAASALLERLLRVQTRGDLRQRERGFASGLYRPSSWVVLRELLRRLPVADDDVFVDVGSGMGRVVLVAARRPFRRVIGIEQDGELTEIARRNLEGRRRACGEVELLTVDAAAWAVPDDLTVVYLYCPFPDAVLGPFLDRLAASLDARPRPLLLIYNFGTASTRALIEATGRARPVDLAVPWYLRRAFDEVRLYRLEAAPGGRGRRTPASAG